MSVKMRQAVEHKILKQAIADFLSAGFRLSVSFERGYDCADCLKGSTDADKIFEEATGVDECHIFVHPATGELVTDGSFNCIGWVYFVYGNDGYDVISDYSVSLEKYLAGANKIADEYS